MKNEYTPIDFGITDQDIVFDVAVELFPDEATDILNANYLESYDPFSIMSATLNMERNYEGDTEKYVSDAQKVAANWKPE